MTGAVENELRSDLRQYVDGSDEPIDRLVAALRRGSVVVDEEGAALLLEFFNYEGWRLGSQLSAVVAALRERLTRQSTVNRWTGIMLVLGNSVDPEDLENFWANFGGEDDPVLTAGAVSRLVDRGDPATLARLEKIRATGGPMARERVANVLEPRE